MNLRFLQRYALPFCGLSMALFVAMSGEAQTPESYKAQSDSVRQPTVGRGAAEARRQKRVDPARNRPFTDMPSFVAWMQATHKAPFHVRSANTDQRKAVEAIARQLADPKAAEIRDFIQQTPEQFGNIKVNTDLNPYQKTVAGVAINPMDGTNIVVASQNASYISTTNARTWTGDFTPTLPVLHNVDSGITTVLTQPNRSTTVGVSIDRSGTTYSALDIQDSSQVDDSPYDFEEISNVAFAVAHNQGLTFDNQPTVVRSTDCNTSQRCDAVVETKGIVTDRSGTASDGATYIWYTYFCNSDPNIGCPDGLNFGDSVIEVVPIAGNTSFFFDSFYADNIGDASVVIDDHGQPHVLEISYTNKPSLGLFLDIDYSDYPITTFAQPDAGLPVLQCDAHGQTAYCVFQTTHVGSGTAQATLDVYLATINLSTAASSVIRVNNDALGKGKQHFDPHVTVTPSGVIYVGWFDNRQDPAGLKFNYFVGKSTDGGKTFPTQRPINDVPFNPSPYNYTSLTSSVVSGPDGAVHAVWTDTRDGAGPQIWTQVLRF